MPVCLLIAEPSDLLVLPLASAYANADDTGLIGLHLRGRTSQRSPEVEEALKAELSACQGEPLAEVACLLSAKISDGNTSSSAFADKWTPYSTANDDTAHYSPKYEVRYLRLRGNEKTAAAIDMLDEFNVTRLIIPPSHVGNSQLEQLSHEVFARASCETILLKGIRTTPLRCDHLLVATAGGEHASAALTGAAELAQSVGGRVTALYVEAAVDDVAQLVGEKIAKSLVRRTLGSIPKHVDIRVEVATSFREGLTRALADQPDVVLLGAPGRGVKHVARLPSCQTKQARNFRCWAWCERKSPCAVAWDDL